MVLGRIVSVYVEGVCRYPLEYCQVRSPDITDEYTPRV